MNRIADAIDSLTSRIGRAVAWLVLAIVLLQFVLVVARYLIGVMEDLARRDYAAPLMKISCFNDNAGGLLLYAGLGYRPVGIVERQAPDGRRVALVQMEKALGPA